MSTTNRPGGVWASACMYVLITNRRRSAFACKACCLVIRLGLHLACSTIWSILRPWGSIAWSIGVSRYICIKWFSKFRWNLSDSCGYITFNVFHNVSSPLSWIFFLNLTYFWTVDRILMANLRYHATFCQNWSNDCRDMAILWFWWWSPYDILDQIFRALAS